jgi:pimeloyl-ACP methyl ester carboxylesterase
VPASAAGNFQYHLRVSLTRRAMTPWLLAAIVGVAAIAVLAAAARYRRDIERARVRLGAVRRRAIQTAWGRVEFTEDGEGEPLLASHGIFHGCDGGIFTVRDLCPGRRVIAPSRFGYLGSALPRGATPSDQADAFAALLESLGIASADVIGVSAGATSALEFALRHPDKVRHLAVLVGNVPGSPTAVVQPSWARWVDRQLPLWILRTWFPSTMARLAGVPASFSLTDEHTRFVARFIDSMFPVTPRVPGVLFDAFVSNAAVNQCPLEAIGVPTLFVHTADDPLASHEASRRAAARVPGARFVSLDSGGHLMLGQTAIIRDVLADFFADGPGAPARASDRR